MAWIAALIAGVALGLISAWAALQFGVSTFTEHHGHWVFSRAAGSTAAGPYTRAVIARDGLLALSAREAVYFSLYEDEQGRPLSESCVYDLNGRQLDARWWSVTLYADDNYLVQNTDSAHSIDASRAGNDGPWRIRISPVRGDATHWLSSREARRGFILMLRVYNPQRDFRPSEQSLPSLTTVSCAGEAP
jgi:hypothetical protein